MKKKLVTMLLFGVAFSMLPTQVRAYSEQKVVRGDTVLLSAPDGFKTYKWQVATDSLSYMDLPSATAKTYQFLAYTPGFYRAVLTAEDGTRTYSDTTKVLFTSVKYSSVISDMSAAQGYCEVSGEPSESITIRGDGRVGTTLQLTGKLTNWSDPAAHAVYYFYHPAAVQDGYLILTATKNQAIQFRLRVYDPNKPEMMIADTYISFKGTGVEQTIPVVGVKRFTKAQYYCYDLQCLKGNSFINNINRWRFRSTTTTKSYVASYLSSPSVHLNSWRTSQAGAPTGRSYDWCYEEVMIPQKSNYSGTYVMSLGVLSGYMGIQVNDNNHDIIFSMWDEGSTDVDPGLASYKRAGAVDASPDVTVSRFGNEGTGVKTFASGQWWKPGTYVQFITNSRPEVATYTIKGSKGQDSTFQRSNTLVSAWFNAQNGKGWQYIATTRLPGAGHYFDSWYSFLEDYGWTSGQKQRIGYYRNGYIHGLNTKKWYHCNKVGFGHTDGGTSAGSRNDYAQGQDATDKNTFFMTSGGYSPTNQTASQIPLNTDNTPVDTIQLNILLARVDLAVAKEAATIKAAADLAASQYDKTGWEMVSFSSEETSGEGTNGRAAEIIDGSTSTYWHSAWSSGSSTFPHWFVVDMKKSQPVNGIQFNLSGGTSRHQKSIDIYGSEDGKTFTKVYSNASCPDQESYYLKFDSTATMRYFKLQINSSQSGVIHTRINEISLTYPLTTAITSASVDKNPFTVYTSSSMRELNVVAPETAKDMVVELYDLSGNGILQQHIYNQKVNEVTTIDLPNVKRGVYVVRCTANKHKYAKSIFVK